ncbi:DUF3006 domain-containing protein [Candidatus Berkelbacteria bacterium]|nr:DUF3006 domain-containing protein [Candidatus Berkelbacteria bacterium]
MAQAPIQLRAVVDRFEGHKGVLLFDDADLLGPLAGQELVLPKRLLPTGCREGDVIVFDMLTDLQATQHRETLARQVLEEILNGR